MILLNKKGESLTGIIIAVFLLATVSLGIGSLISNSRGLIYRYEDKLVLDLLTINSNKIIKKIDLSLVPDGEIFFLYKNITDPNNLMYEIKVGEPNSEYKYINKNGDKVDVNTYNKEIYLRYFYLKKISINGEDRVFIDKKIKKLVK